MSESGKSFAVRGTVFNIQYYCIHDGPGIRTTVFLKGCALHCKWCSNPESISPKPELGFIKAKCSKCGKCAAACPEGAISGTLGEIPAFNREICINCGKCVPACHYGALAIYGQEMTAEELYEAVRKDELFYRRSGGGVTLSGGEPLQQPELVLALFALCRSAGIHTAIETTGHTSSQVLAKVLSLTDYVLFDLKHMSAREHGEHTGQGNELILANARQVAESGVPVLFRMPVIPGVNDTDRNIRETAAFLKSLGENAPEMELLPFHRMGSGKYEGLGKPYLLEGVLPPGQDQMEAVRSAFEGLGIVCTFSR
jgi:pyruvate formate lyase activating enzyme